MSCLLSNPTSVKASAETKKELLKTFQAEQEKIEPEIQSGLDYRSGVEKVRASWKDQLDSLWSTRSMQEEIQTISGSQKIVL